MKTLGMFVYFSVEKETEDSYTLSNGLELWLDTAVNKMQNARQWGHVHSVPENLEKYKRYDDGVELKKGDKIWFHHFVVEEDSRMRLFDEDVYKLPYEQIFAVERDGDVIPLNDFVFLEPEAKTSRSETVIDINEGEYSDKYGKVLYTGRIGSEMGLSVGDRVLFHRTPYTMKMNGVDVYKMKSDYILAVLENEIQY